MTPLRASHLSIAGSLSCQHNSRVGELLVRGRSIALLVRLKLDLTPSPCAEFLPAPLQPYEPGAITYNDGAVDTGRPFGDSIMTPAGG